MEQSRSVAAVDLDDRVMGARLIVDQHARRDLEGTDSLRQLALEPRQLFGGRQAGQHALDHHQQLRPLAIGERIAAGVLSPEHVERHAVRKREDLGVDDRQAGHREGARQTREQPVMVGGVDRDLGGVTLRVAPCFDRERLGIAFRPPHQPRMPRMRRRVERQPIGVRAQRREFRELRISDAVRAMLGYDEGRQAEWRDNAGSAWQLFYFISILSLFFFNNLSFNNFLRVYVVIEIICCSMITLFMFYVVFNYEKLVQKIEIKKEF